MILKFIRNNYKSIPLILLLLFIIFIIGFFIFIFLSYKIYLYVKKYIKNKYIYVKDDYDNISKKNLKIYGKYKIRNIYVVYEHVKIPLTLKKIFTYFTCKNTWNNKILEVNNLKTIMKHNYLIVEIKKKNKSIKLIKIEKIPFIRITTNIRINKDTILIPLKNKVNISINELLNKTKIDMGNKFFTYDFYNNDCFVFIKKILKQLYIKKSEYIKYDKTIKQRRIMKKYIKPYESMYFILNVVYSLFGNIFTDIFYI